jgi:glucosamine--fructose-6-phosphate aminotransferase (isomerizing)
MSFPAYVNDILAQPEALRRCMSAYSAETLRPLAAKLRDGEFDRVVVTGMGASWSAAYPACLALSRLGLPVLRVETSELYHSCPDQVGPATLLWVISQSGRSAEVVGLLEKLQERQHTALLAITNTPDSPLFRQADCALLLQAGDEYTVSTKTYLNTLALAQLVATQLCGDELEPAKAALLSAGDALQSYLAAWSDHVVRWKELLNPERHLFLLGRGFSRATVETGALILKEASKVPAEGMDAGEFRHGPFELVDERLSALVFAGDAATQALNHRLALDILDHGGQPLWLSEEEDDRLPSVRIPAVEPVARPLAEILPVQMLTIALAEQQGLVPGAFRHLGKVVDKE